MAGFPKKERQRIIDEYLMESGNNMYVPHVFIDWLREQPDNEAYDWFYGFDDTHHARENRIHLARKMASGLRIVVKETHTDNQVISLSRYRGCAENIGLDMSSLEDIVQELRGVEKEIA